MTTSARQVMRGARPGDLGRASDPARVLVRVMRSMWLAERGVVESRWAAVTLLAIAGLAVTAKLLDPVETGFDRAISLAVPGTLLAIALGWTARGARIAADRRTRWLLGPALLLAMMIAAGPMDPGGLALPAASPLVVLAFTFTALTPGYPVAATILAVAWIGTGLAHIPVTATGSANDLRDEYLVAGAVAFLATTGFHLVVRIASEAESRANRVAARSRARVDALEKLARVSRGFDGSRPIQEILQDLVTEVSREFDIALVSLYLPDGPGRLSMVGVAGYHRPFHEIAIGSGVVGRVAATREAAFIADVLDDPDYRAARDDVRSEVAVPIVHEGELLGVINFEGTLASPLGHGHVALAEMLARSIAAALRSARLAEERRERLHAIERVLEVSRGLVSDLDRDRTLRAVVEAAADLLSADTVAIALRDLDDRYLVEHEIRSDLAADPLEPRWLGPGDAAAREAIELGAPVIRAGTTSDGASGPSVLALPIDIGGVVAAVLTVTRPSGSAPFGPVELGIADLLVSQVAVALHNAERHALVSDAAVRDPLTGLLNRRYFDEAVETAFATARRSESPLSLIVLDLDRFSEVNNDHGHATGDRMLRTIATTIADSVRAGDMVARYGGEEFVVIAPGSTTEQAIAVAERVRSAVARALIVTTTIAEGSLAEGVTLSITVSAGVASLIGDERDGHALFRAADSALLAAKRAGRDRVVAV